VVCESVELRRELDVARDLAVRNVCILVLFDVAEK
jgi:hypothetical protein